MLTFAAICPHPPIIIPGIGGKELNKVKKTVLAMEKLAKDFALAKPETTIIISPHGPVQYSAMTIVNSERLEGSFYNFGDLETKMSFENDPGTIKTIKAGAEKQNIPIGLIDRPDLDHGTLVPLYYLIHQPTRHPELVSGSRPPGDFSSPAQNDKIGKIKIVPIAFSFLDFQTHFKFGQTIGKEIQKSNKKIALVASGDLSHRVTPDAPAGYSPRGKEFDEKLVDLLKTNNAGKILEMDSDLIEEAGECGLRSIIILLGALCIMDYKFDILSYEAPFGVGYLVAKVNF